MNFEKIPAGKDIPHDIYGVIEIPAMATPVKYEVDKHWGAVVVDRFMPTPMFYPVNYGFMPHTLAGDGDPVDLLILTPHPLMPGAVIRCRPVGVLRMEDDGGEDAKVLAMPHSKLTPIYDDIQDIDQVPTLLKQQIEHFFQHYKALEPGKWVKLGGWADAEAARAEIVAGIERHDRQAGI